MEKLRIIIDNDHSRIRYFEKKNNVGNPPGKRLIESKEISVDHDKSITNILKNSQKWKFRREFINKNTNNFNKIRIEKTKMINNRSKFNHFVFHLSNPLIIFVRDFILRNLVKNKKFLENYLGKIYKN